MFAGLLLRCAEKLGSLVLFISSRPAIASVLNKTSQHEPDTMLIMFTLHTVLYIQYSIDVIRLLN